MFGKKPKAAPEPEKNRRHVQRDGGTQAFSYYSSRLSSSAGAEDRFAKRAPQSEAKKDKPVRTIVPRSVLANISLWVFLVVVAVCLVKIALLSTSPKIVIVGGTAASEGYLRSNSTYAAAAQKLLANSLTNRSKLTVNTSSVIIGLKHDFPELLDASMSVPLIGNRPVIYIQPASASLVLRELHGDYLLNNSGVVLAVAKTLPSGVPVAVDQFGLDASAGKQVLPSSMITFAQSVEYQFSAAHLTISTFILPSGSPYELDVRLESKPYLVRFNLEEDARLQSGVALATVNQLGSATVPSAYIDVRVPGRVYYK